jgi:hypothetical protein
MTPEVRAFEYAMGLFAVLIGLAVADVATSFHRLARSKFPVHWDPLALGVAGYTLCMAVYMWFDIWGVRNFAITRHFLFYLGLVAQLFVLFLAAAASLPDEVHAPTDLREYYARNRRYLWGLIALFQFGYCAFGVYFATGESAKLPFWISVLMWSLMIAPFAVSIALAALKSRALHYAGLFLMVLLMLMHYVPAQIN